MESYRPQSVVAYLYPLTRVPAPALEGRTLSDGRLLQHSLRVCQCASLLHPGSEFSWVRLHKVHTQPCPLQGRSLPALSIHAPCGRY